MKINDDNVRFRVEEDALGTVNVPADHLWGAQTQRSHLNFPIGVEAQRAGVAPQTTAEELRDRVAAIQWVPEYRRTGFGS